MAVLAKSEITLSHMIDVVGTYRYYLLQSSTLSPPEKPTVFPPTGGSGDTFTWNGDVTGLETFDFEGAVLYHISNNAPTIFEILNAEGTGLRNGTIEITDGYTTLSANLSEAYFEQMEGDIYAVQAIYVVNDITCAYVIFMNFPTNGIWATDLLINLDTSEQTSGIWLKRLTIEGYTGFSGGGSGDPWDDTEPTYTSGSTNSLYVVDCSVYSNGTFYYSPVSLSTSYEAAKEAYNKAENAQNSADNAQSSVDSLTQTVTDQHATIIYDCEKILFSALESYTKTGNFETFKQETEAALQLLSDEMTLKFTETTQQIVNVNNDLQEKFNTITKYFTFDINGLTIGQVDNPFKVIIDNDRYSMTVNGIEVLWLDPDGKSNIPALSVTTLMNLLGYVIDEDSTSQTINCGWGGVS